MAATKYRLALIQLAVSANKSENLKRAGSCIREAKERGARIVTLPECFNSPYGTQYFAKYAEAIPGETTNTLSAIAKELNIFLVGGSIPEIDESNGTKYYNTCTVFNPKGDLIGKFRKAHLFDIDVPGKITFKESDVLSPGNNLCTFDVENLKVGIGICYDLRFQELSRTYDNMGCKLLLFPGAFNMTTGPAHWKLLLRGRALDNQLYIGGCSPAHDETASYQAWGHSAIVSPWGEVVAEAGEKEEIIYSDIDVDYVNEIRQQIPTHFQKRKELYNA